MELKNGIKATGKLVIKVFDEAGNLKQEVNTPNQIVNVGKAWIANRLIATNAGNRVSHMGIGVIGGAVAAIDTTLTEEVGRVAITAPSVSGTTVTYAATFGTGVGTAGGAAEIQEAGLFTSGAAGTMLAKTSFPTITKNETDSMQITWQVQIN